MRASSCLHAVLLATLCVVAAGIRPAAACSCVGGQTPCQAFASSPIVFVGDVLSVEETGGQFHMRLHVVRALKGITAATADLWSDAHSSCGVRLEEGARYVIYTASTGGRMSLHACGYGQRLEPGEPGPDLPPVPGRIYGRVARYDIDRIREFKSLEPIPSVRVSLDLPAGRVTTASDQWGRFRFADVPPGQYAFSVDAGQGLTPWGQNLVILPDRAACVASQIVLQPSGRVSGQVLTSDVGEGSTIELDRPFVLPAPLATRTFRVSVTCRDGSLPAAVSARASAPGARFAEFDESGDGPVRTLNLVRD